MFGGPGFMRRRQTTQRLHIVIVILNIGFGQLFGRDAPLVGAVDNLVIHVRKIADKGHLIAGESEITIDDIKGDKGPRMADMGAVVDRDPTHIHAGFARCKRNELFCLSRQGVVKTQSHAIGLPPA